MERSTARRFEAFLRDPVAFLEEVCGEKLTDRERRLVRMLLPDGNPAEMTITHHHGHALTHEELARAIALLEAAPDGGGR
jgi:uncharacterized membrane protein